MLNKSIARMCIRMVAMTVVMAFVVACNSESDVTITPAPATDQETPITLTSHTNAVTRATGATAAKELNYQFTLYGAKEMQDGTTQNVFAHTSDATIASAGNLYTVWYNGGAQTSTTNASGWEYVGQGSQVTPGPDRVNVPVAQTIKFWDYSARQYDFIAFCNLGGATVSDISRSGFKLNASARQLDNLFVVDKVVAGGASAVKIGDPITFRFRRASTRVRMGMYETIPGYYVRNITFRPKDAEASKVEVYVSGEFANTGSDEYNKANDIDVSFDATTNEARFTNVTTGGAGSASTYFSFGTMNTAFTDPNATANAGIATTSAQPTWAVPTGGEAGDYTATVATQGAPMTLKVDYQLYKPQTGEIINVTGAAATVPAPFMGWEQGKAYTYLFKISDNTNGTTGTEGTSLEGLYPITFDGVAITGYDDLGTVSTMTTPTITTYELGSVDVVSDEGITYVKDANHREPIYITVTNGGELQEFTIDTSTRNEEMAKGKTDAEAREAINHVLTEPNMMKLWRFQGTIFTEAQLHEVVNEGTGQTRFEQLVANYAGSGNRLQNPNTSGTSYLNLLATNTTDKTFSFEARKAATLDGGTPNNYVIEYTYYPAGTTTLTRAFKVLRTIKLAQ